MLKKENKSKQTFEDWGDNFQTPQNVCEYMASFLPRHGVSILEPTSGKRILAKALQPYGRVEEPVDFFKMAKKRYDYIVMNPPFSPMQKGYDILYRCMEMSDNIIALMPYLTIINSQKRTDLIMNFGLKSITHLPRNTFKGSRVQTCILEMQKGFKGDTIFRQFPKQKQ